MAMMEEDEDEPGTYSADYPVAIPDGAHDGTYDITVKFRGPM